MRRTNWIFRLLLIAISSHSFSSCQKTSEADLSKRKVVLVILDGIPAEMLERVETPNLDQIAGKGTYVRALMGGERGGFSETPTISAVGYNSMLTGTWVHKHNVKDNNIQFPNYHYWTIFRHFKEANPLRSTAIYSTWLDNRTKLLGDSLPETGYFKVDRYFDGLELDSTKFPHDTLSRYIHEIDKLVAERAAADVRALGPDLVWVYLQYTDDMGHRYGDSQEMESAVWEADRQIGQIWKAIQTREAMGEEFLLIVTTDHGRAEGGFHHGGQSDSEREIWLLSNKPFNRRASSLPAIVDVFPTVARFLGTEIPRSHAMELDGVPLIGQIYAANLKAHVDGSHLALVWDCLGSDAEAVVWASFSNQFRYGKEDQYIQLAKVRLEDAQAHIDISQYDFKNAKIILELPDGFLNYWVKRD